METQQIERTPAHSSALHKLNARSALFAEK